MAELEIGQDELAMAHAEFSRSRAEIGSQVGLLRFLNKNDMSQPPQEEMSHLEVTMVELRRVQAELATSHTQFMEEVHRPS